MKYRKISFINHPVLGSVCFDFTDNDGRTVDTIILAGENGCGKTFLLSFINTYNPSIPARQLGYSLSVEVELDEYDLSLLHGNKDFERSLGHSFYGNIVTFVHSTNLSDDLPRAEFMTKDGTKVVEYAYLFVFNLSILRSVFSDVEINFTPGSVQHTTSSNLDSDLTGPIRSSKNIATEIKQLLVDINELDNEDLASWVDSHDAQAPTEDVKHRRIRRFTNAFDQMFPHKHFRGITNDGNQKNVLFEEYGKKMDISQLSSGEKQIVFRGGFLLRDIGSINGGVILVDEPELSLHPQWQLKILGFLKNLFTDKTGRQLSQIIIATHSPFILHNDTRANDKVLILQKNEEGEIVVLDKPKYYNWSESSTVEEAFNVSPLQSDKKVIVFLEGETDELYFNKAMEVYAFDSSKLLIKWIGHYSGGVKNKPENTGEPALNSAAAFFSANPFIMNNKKVYLLYDCDTNKPDAHDGSLFVGAMTKNDKATNYQKGVENLLDLPIAFDYSQFYNSNCKTDDYGATRTIENLNKTKLAEYIINLPKSQLKIILKNVKTEISKILTRTGE